MSDLSFNISTKNGTGSTSTNQILTRILFRSGWHVASYNFFPSNIAGLSCLYYLRLNSKKFTSFTGPTDVLISLNPKSFPEDRKELKKGGLLITDSKAKAYEDFQGLHWKLPITETLRQIPQLSIKEKTLLKNMVYLAFISQLLKLDFKIIKKSLEDFFQKSEIVQKNLSVFEKVSQWASHYELPYPIPPQSPPQKKQILIDGNSSSAIGALFAGCQFVSWYPITPASSLVEKFEELAGLYQKDSQGKNKVMVLQAEDELAAISQVIGAGWAGLRAMTCTSGPGLSLMAEAAGLSYFAEVPAVICHVQRAGPSTGLPTRTQQSDLLSVCFLSHGDSKHIVLMPANPEECFRFTKLALELAEQLQTLVIVLTDLDLGLNLKSSPYFKIPKEFTLKERRTLKAEDLDKKDFHAYGDEQGDGISYRSLPGIKHPKGSYFTRGSGHNYKAEYSEKPEDYTYILNKLNKKWESAKNYMPAPIIENQEKAQITFITFGSNEACLQELREELLTTKKLASNYLRVCSFPFPDKHMSIFLEQQSKIFIVEQNRDAQLKQLLSGEFPKESHKMISLLQYDGRPLMLSHLREEFKKKAPEFF